MEVAPWGFKIDSFSLDTNPILFIILYEHLIIKT